MILWDMPQAGRSFGGGSAHYLIIWLVVRCEQQSVSLLREAYLSHPKALQCLYRGLHRHVIYFLGNLGLRIIVSHRVAPHHISFKNITGVRRPSPPNPKCPLTFSLPLSEIETLNAVDTSNPLPSLLHRLLFALCKPRIYWRVSPFRFGLFRRGWRL